MPLPSVGSVSGDSGAGSPGLFFFHHLPSGRQTDRLDRRPTLASLASEALMTEQVVVIRRLTHRCHASIKRALGALAEAAMRSARREATETEALRAAKIRARRPLAFNGPAARPAEQLRSFWDLFGLDTGPCPASVNAAERHDPSVAPRMSPEGSLERARCHAGAVADFDVDPTSALEANGALSARRGAQLVDHARHLVAELGARRQRRLGMELQRLFDKRAPLRFVELPKAEPKLEPDTQPKRRPFAAR